MTATLEIADAHLAEAKHGIDNPGTMTEAEIHDLLAAAKRLTDRTLELMRLDAVEAAGKDALAELDRLEKVRRLLAYGTAMGRTTAEGAKLAALLATRPRLEKSKGIRTAAASFEWLRANRREIHDLLATIIPSDQ